MDNNVAINILSWIKGTKSQEQKDKEALVNYYLKSPILSRPPTLKRLGDVTGRLVSSKYDTAPDMVSSDTANNFSLGVLPSGINSVSVE
jgi:hypothetical protein